MKPQEASIRYPIAKPPFVGDPGHYKDASKPGKPRQPLTLEQRERRNLRARARRAERTPEQQEQDRSRARAYHQRTAEAVRAYQQSCNPSYTPAPNRPYYQGVQRGSLAHRVLQALQEGPQSARHLGAGTRFGVPTGTSAQIIRLLERGLIEHNNITGLYNLAPTGERLLRALAPEATIERVSKTGQTYYYTPWDRGE